MRQFEETQNEQNIALLGLSVRTLTDDNGDPWFVAKDVCDALGLMNTAQAISSLEVDEKSTIINNDCFNNSNHLRKGARAVSEPGIYTLISKSRKPEAKAFKKVGHLRSPSGDQVTLYVSNSSNYKIHVG